MESINLTISEKVAEVMQGYYCQADVLHPGSTELTAWVAQLVPSEQAGLQTLRVCQAMELPAFRRYILENRGLSLRAYMLTHLSQAELTYWIASGSGGVWDARSA